MTWTAPPVHREQPGRAADERAALAQWLAFHRLTLLHKCAGLTGAQLAEAVVPPSPLTLLGLVRHMTDVERAWFRRRFAGADLPPLYYTDEHPDDDLLQVDPARAAADLAAYRQECELADQAAAGRALTDTFVRHGYVLDLRWVYLHMIEEYARHNGHADLLRERIDGATGA